MLVLGDNEVRGLVTMSEAIELMRVAHAELGRGEAQIIPRGRMVLQPNRRFFFNCIPGLVPSMNVCAVRLDAYVRPIIDNRYVGVVLLFSIDTGEWIATLPDFTISAIRVAATSAVVADLVARKGASKIGILGSGHQARAHLEAISLVRPPTRIRAYSPTRAHLDSFCEQMTTLVGQPVVAADPDAVVEGADIIIAATNTREPVFDGSLLRPGTHVVTIRGLDKFGTGREVDSATCQRADLGVFNSFEQVQIDRQTAETEALDRLRSVGASAATEAAEVVAGHHPGRTSSDQVTVHFNNGGQGIQFAAIGQQIFERARARGLGREVPSEWFYTDLQPAIDAGRVGSRWTDPHRS